MNSLLPLLVYYALSTYIGIRSAFVYLAVILDLFARRAIGYALSRYIDTALCLDALHMAISNRNPPKGVIHHSDRGVQYAAHMIRIDNVVFAYYIILSFLFYVTSNMGIFLLITQAS